MRIALTVVLIAAALSGTLSQDDDGNEPGTSDNPLPEDHEGEDAPHPDDGEGEDEGDGEDEGEGDDATKHLEHYEDTGEGQDITAQHLRHLHTKLDKDGDGKVAMHEVMHFADNARKAVVQKEIEGIFDEIDSTKDGHLSLEEHMTEMAEFHEGDEEEKEKQKQHEIAKFKAADENNDGKLDKEELPNLMHPEIHPEVFELHAKEEMRKKDANSDGKLSKAEWGDPEGEDQSVHDFPKVDANGDGFVDMKELEHYESGRYHTEDAMKKLLEIADKDSDGHFTADELAHVVDKLEGHDAHPHLLDWVFHEEL